MRGPTVGATATATTTPLIAPRHLAHVLGAPREPPAVHPPAPHPMRHHISQHCIRALGISTTVTRVLVVSATRWQVTITHAVAAKVTNALLVVPTRIQGTLALPPAPQPQHQPLPRRHMHQVCHQQLLKQQPPRECPLHCHQLYNRQPMSQVPRPRQWQQQFPLLSLSPSAAALHQQQS